MSPLFIAEDASLRHMSQHFATLLPQCKVSFQTTRNNPISPFNSSMTELDIVVQKEMSLDVLLSHPSMFLFFPTSLVQTIPLTVRRPTLAGAKSKAQTQKLCFQNHPRIDCFKCVIQIPACSSKHMSKWHGGWHFIWRGRCPTRPHRPTGSLAQ